MQSIRIAYRETNANAPTEYRHAKEKEVFMTPAQKNTIQKVLFAGYPYNGKGYLDPIYDHFGESGKHHADTLAADITQAVMWNFMSKWQIPGNPAYKGEVQFDSQEEFVDKVITDITNYAHSTSPAASPASNEVKINGSGEIKESNGVFRTDELSITDPEHCSLTYELNTPEGVTAVDTENNELLTVKEKEPFYLTTEDHESIADDDTLNVEATLAFPGNTIYQYNTDSKPKYIIDGKDKYQTMLGADVQTVNFSGTLSLSVKSVDPKGKDPENKDPEGKDPDNDTPGKNTSGNNTPGGDDPVNNSPDRNDSTNRNNDGSKEKDAAVDTGDPTPVFPLAGMLLAAAAGIVLTVYNRR